jgi:hypothetical protein
MNKDVKPEARVGYTLRFSEKAGWRYYKDTPADAPVKKTQTKAQLIA